MIYYWLFIILLFGAKLLKDKELSSYTIKWMWTYVIYLLWLQVAIFDSNWSKYEKDIFDYTLFAFVFPLSLYLFFPFIWKFLSKWGIFRRIEKIVDYWYNTIKNKC